MLKQRPAGDKSWPIACSGATLGTSLTAWGNSLIDWGNSLIDFTGADLTNTDLGDSEISYGSYGSYGYYGSSVIDFSDRWQHDLIDFSEVDLTEDNLNFLVGFTGADLTNSTDLGDSEIYYGSYGYYGSSPSVIDFSV